ncbi:hypothetical protein V6O07_15450, partial [Arthrospira platensis SPKY2]
GAAVLPSPSEDRQLAAVYPPLPDNPDNPPARLSWQMLNGQADLERRRGLAQPAQPARPLGQGELSRAYQAWIDGAAVALPLSQNDSQNDQARPVWPAGTRPAWSTGAAEDDPD